MCIHTLLPPHPTANAAGIPTRWLLLLCSVSIFLSSHTCARVCESEDLPHARTNAHLRVHVQPYCIWSVIQSQSHESVVN